MRLRILYDGLPFLARVKFSMFKGLTLGGPPEMLLLFFYRPELFGQTFGACTEVALRGASAWTHGEREAIAALVSRTNSCPFCAETHAYTATRLGQPSEPETALAAGNERLAAGLHVARAVTRLEGLAERVAQAAESGLSLADLEGVIAVAGAFNVINRIVSALGFPNPTAHQLRVGAFMVRRFGYGAGLGGVSGMAQASSSAFETFERLEPALLAAPGHTPAETRRAFVTRARSLALGEVTPAIDLPAELLGYADQVATAAHRVTDGDLQGLLVAGHPQDALLEVTIAAALGAGQARVARGRDALRGL